MHTTSTPRILTLAAGTLLAGALLLAAPASASAGLDQDIDSEQTDATGRTVISAGHVDLGMLYRDETWALRLHDDSTETPVWRALDDVVLAVTDAAVRAVPETGFDFLGLDAGSDAHVVPQAEAPGIVWVGWNTQDPGVMAEVQLGVTLRVTSVSGPGEMTVYLQSGSFGEPEVLFTTLDAFPQDAWIELNTHTHANWVFGSPGAYLVGIEYIAQTIAGEEVRTPGTLRFAVGDETDPEAVFALAAEPILDAGDDADAAQERETTTDADPITWVWIAAGAITVAVVLTVLVGATRTRRARRESSDAGA